MKNFLIYIFLCLIFSGNISFCEENISELRKNAIGLYNTNDIENAFEILKNIPDEQKTSEDYLLMANIQQDYENEDKALEYLKEAIKKDKKYYKAYYNMGLIYIQNKQYLLAIESFQKTTKLNKDFAFAYYNLGCCYYELQNYKTAKSYFNRAILRKNDAPDFYYNLAMTYKKLKNEKKAQIALNAYNKLTK